MTLTRSGFLRAILGAFSFGQVKGAVTGLPGLPEIWSRNNRARMEADGSCLSDEERCPLGHCQQRKDLIVQHGGDLALLDPKKFGHTLKQQTMAIETAPCVIPSVCSICGIVYVPVKEKP